MVLMGWVAESSAQTLPQASKGRKDTSVVRLDESWDAKSVAGFVQEFGDDQGRGLTPLDLNQILKGNEGESSAENGQVPGFRIQLIATRDEMEARQARTDALLNFSENVYMLYDNPYYKLRLGDCRSHAEADSLHQKAIDKGFVNAWIVATTVNTHPVQMRRDSLSPADTLRH